MTIIGCIKELFWFNAPNIQNGFTKFYQILQICKLSLYKVNHSDNQSIKGILRRALFQYLWKWKTEPQLSMPQLNSQHTLQISSKKILKLGDIMCQISCTYTVIIYQAEQNIVFKIKLGGGKRSNQKSDSVYKSSLSEFYTAVLSTISMSKISFLDTWKDHTLLSLLMRWWMDMAQ